jgi:hypothetical protein
VTNTNINWYLNTKELAKKATMANIDKRGASGEYTSPTQTSKRAEA